MRSLFLLAGLFTVSFCCTASAASWTGDVANGWSTGDGKTLSEAGTLGNVQSDNGDGVSAAKIFADKGDNFTDLKWLSVHFDNDFPTSATTIQSVKILVDHQGPAGTSGTLVIHVSDNRGASNWRNGGTGGSDGNSGNVSWNGNEQRYEYDVTSILDTPAKINNSEILILNKFAGIQDPRTEPDAWIGTRRLHLQRRLRSGSGRRCGR